MLHAEIPAIVFSSSCAIYGEPSHIPIVETTPLNPINPYGFTKLACERMTDDFGRAYGLKSARLRYFNAAGADPTGEISEDHLPETHLIPLVLDVATGSKSEIQIFGTDYKTSERRFGITSMFQISLARTSPRCNICSVAAIV
jgi:UDP-glucose 4-epimerase